METSGRCAAAGPAADDVPVLDDLPVPDDLPVLDGAGFAEVRAAYASAGAPLDELIALFETDADEALGALAGAVSAGDGEARARLAHRLKGSALTLGASRVAALCAQLENEGGDLAPLAEALRAAVGAMRAAL